jgi:hypothetical protein
MSSELAWMYEHFLALGSTLKNQVIRHITVGH